MRGYNLLWISVCVAIMLSLLQLNVYGQYWFQSGVKAGYGASQNNGASVYIETIEPQNSTYGSFGFWIGESLQNGAFLQIGYEIPNASGYYPSGCSVSGCNGSVYLEQGVATWFWEYFPAGYNGSKFYGSIGGNDSAGLNGTFNEYSFKSSGDIWSFYVDNKAVGSVDLGTSSSGSSAPSAFAELANVNSNDAKMLLVIFRNLSVDQNGRAVLAPDGYSYIGYGKNSETGLSNPYGVKEASGLADFFEVGSGIPRIANGTALWSNIYHLSIASEYGNATGGGYYSVFSKVNITVPEYVYLSHGVRAVFDGWSGTGVGSYSGPDDFASVAMNENITEVANWQLQYLVEVGSAFGSASGSGWYYPNSTTSISMKADTTNTSEGVREVFVQWNNGAKNLSLTATVSHPINFSAVWQKQYLVTLTTPYGNASGNGWYNTNSTARISVDEEYVNVTNDSRVAFYSWSNLYNQSNLSFVVDSPVHLNAIYKIQYLTYFGGTDYYAMPLNVSHFSIDNSMVNGSVFLFSNTSYHLKYVYYKGTLIPLNYTFTVSNSTKVVAKLPVFDVQITALSLLKKPLNASFSIVFSNGTSLAGRLGPAGSITLYDVPFGYVSGYVEYLGIKERLIAQGGSPVTLFFITPSIAWLVAVIVAAMVVVSVVERHLTRKRYKHVKRW